MKFGRSGENGDAFPERDAVGEKCEREKIDAEVRR